MREYSEKFHHIACWKKFPDDYVKIVSDFIDFLKVRKTNNVNYLAVYYFCVYLLCFDLRLG